MSRRLPPPPSAAELVELARRLAEEAPGLLPAFLCSVCRSSRAARAFLQLDLSGAALASLRAYPTGAKLIASSRQGDAWLRRWTATERALDELLPRLE